MKVAIVTGVWKRFEVFDMFAKGVKELERRFPEVEIITIIAGSQGKRSEQRAEQYGFNYIEVPNQPLSKKMQSTIDAAALFDPDYVLCMGSDDIIHPDLFREYLKSMHQGVDYIGCIDFYFYHINKRRSIYWGGYMEAHRKGVLCGAGRCLSRNLLDKLDWIVWNSHDGLLDTSMEIRLKKVRYTKRAINLRKEKLFALDIKSSINMTPFQMWDNTRRINNNIILKKFSYIF